MEGSTAALESASASAVAQQGSSSWIGMFANLILSTISLLYSVLYSIIKLTTFSIPSLLYTLFSTSLTVTMNATTLMLIIALVFSLVSWFVRYRYLNMYSRLPPEPQRKEPDVDLFPDTHPGGSKPGLSNYLDEFLSAIKIFGYLERPVFHELTRSMQTRKLIAGETFNLEEEKGFCMVVDGLVEIFVKSARAGQHPVGGHCSIDSDDSDEQEEYQTGNQRYQLLTEVHNGAPMSSLFSIMSLFTEDIKLLQGGDDGPEPPSATGSYDTPSYGLGGKFSKQREATVSVPTTPQLDRSNPHDASLHDGDTNPSHIPPMTLDPPPQSRLKRPAASRQTTTSVHPDIIARATVDTTIAIIPASAFRRLIQVYPKYTAHIVHVILSRFQRVTLATAYNYLGLTSEVMHIEKSMIDNAVCQLPNFLRGDALTRLKEKFSQERERIGEKDCTKGIALHNSSTGRRRKSTASLRKEAALQAISNNKRQNSATGSPPVAPRDGGIQTPPTSGDLLMSIKLSRSGGRRSTNTLETSNKLPTMLGPVEADVVSPLSQRSSNPFETRRHAHISLNKRETRDEDGVFRQSILECMFKAIGLTTSGTGAREPGSADASPRMGSYDQIRQRGFSSSNAFGFIDPYAGSGDGDADSITSGGTAPNQPVNPNALAHDMKDEVEIVFFPKGSVLVEQGERNPGLYYIVDGFLDVCMSAADESSGDILKVSKPESTFDPGAPTWTGPQDHHHDSPDRGAFMGFETQRNEARKRPRNIRRNVALIKPGGLAGYVGSISSHRSFIDVVAKTDVYVGFLPRQSLERIVDRYPIVLLTMAKRLTNLLPKLILHIDFALEWLQVNAGEVIFRGGEESEAIYIVLNGRLRLVEDRQEGGVDVLGEFGQGESIGELEVLTESVRSGTLHAIRNTELVKFPRTLFNSLAQEHPNITIKISKIIASRMRKVVNDPSTFVGKEGALKASLNKSSSTLNLRTVAILPVTAGVPVVEFGNRLMGALTQVGTPNGATSLSQSAILNHLGRHAFNKMGNLKLSQYLADLEEKYGLVVYIADTSVNSPWTQTCITQADCILLVGLGEGSPEIGEYERFMLGMKSTARKVLVLLHAERYATPGLTRSWLRNRMWINGGHHHVQMAFRTHAVPINPATKRAGPSLKERVQILQAEIQKYTSRKVQHSHFYSPDAPFKGDFHRLARRLCSKSVGLVLGGGGARGLAHVGIIRAMEESGIPIDIVGGTSIGAFVGALYASHADVVPIFGLAKKFAGRMSSMWRFALDLTYPSASYTTGHEFNRGIFKSFGKAQMEDFWLEFYCNTTNISKSRQEIHTSGYAWRYVRASMSLAGLLPPLCDEGSMLLDGGYIDNLTVSHMKSLGVDIIFAVDVGSLDDDVPQKYGDTLSGLWAFVNRWNPLSTTPNPPTLAEIQARLAYVSSVDALERAKTTPGTIYMRPPIDEYGTLEFGKFDEIVQVGYKYGLDFLQKLRDEGALPVVEETEAKKALRRTMAPRRASI